MKTITVTGGDLYHLAEQYLGDATQWDRIAKLNWPSGPWDPALQGVVTLKLPAVDPNAGGGVDAFE